MREPAKPPEAAEGVVSGRVRPRRRGQGPMTTVTALLVAVAGLVAALLTRPLASAAAADNPNPYQRGPAPTVASVAASRGPFATAQTSVGSGYGFKDATIYYPTDTSLGTWGAVAIVPGYTAQFAKEEAWMGPWLSSFGFVVIGIDTNSPNDFDTARGTQLLAALDYLTTKSTVRDRVDPNRLGVIGHSMGGGGVVYATEHRPSLKAAVALAPFSPSQNMSTDKVPTLTMGARDDGTVTPSYLDGLLATMPAGTQSAFVQLTSGGHGFPTWGNSAVTRRMIPWLKIFLDDDTRYTQFFCPTLADTSSVSTYRTKCPYVPPGGTTTGGTTTGGTTTGGTTTGGTTTGGTTTGGTTTGGTTTVGTTTGGTTTGGTTTGGTTTGGTTTGGTTTGGTTTGGTATGGSTSGGSNGSGCTATYTTVNAWSGGYQGEVKVAVGNAAVDGWSVQWTLGSGQNITQVWNGTLTTSGSSATVTNASYNGSIPASSSTTFGFLANGTPTTPSLTCTTR